MKRLAIFLLFCATAHSQFTNSKSIWSRPIDSAAPTDGYALTWSASQGKYVFSSAAGPAALVATVNTAASTCTITGGVGGETCTASPTAGTCSLAATHGLVITHNYGSGTLVPILAANDSTGDEFGGQPTTAVCGVKATTTNSVTISLTAASGAGAQFRITNAQSGPIGPAGPTGPQGIPGTNGTGFTSINRAIGCIMGSPTAGSALTTSDVCYVAAPFACAISAWTLMVDAGTITIDVWKIATGTAIPTVANTITASALPAIASGTALRSTTLTSWTTSVAANDLFGFKVNTVATAKFVNATLTCNQTVLP